MSNQSTPNSLVNFDEAALQNAGPENVTTLEDLLADVFDRYSTALDSGDHLAAEAVLAEHPAIAERFRGSLQGLYLLGCASREEEPVAPYVEPAQHGTLGDFEIEKEIGRGGMGIVYSAMQISLRRRVALKVLPFASVLDPRQVTRFRNEAQAAASLHHPNIVPVYGFGCERGVHYYSMQLIEGRSLEQFVDEMGRISRPDDPTAPAEFQDGAASTVVSIQTRNHVRRIIEMGAQAAAAIEFAHQQGIVHRDIKPSNLLLDHGGKVWVADFGLARCRGISGLTSQGDHIGTARYMSPEQATGKGNLVDFRTDIYSLGVTLYELLTLRPAFDAPDRDQLRRAIESRDPAPLRSVNASVSIGLQTVIGKAISKIPGDRYSSAGEFGDDLLRCLAGTPVLAKRQTVLDRIGKSIANRKWLIVMLGMAFLAIAVVTSMIAFAFYEQNLRERASAERARFFLQQAHAAVDRFAMDFTDRLQPFPGTETLRATLLSEAIGYYSDFLSYANDAPEMGFQRARACTELAGLHARAGNDDQARKFLDAATEQMRALADHPAKTPDLEFEQAVCLDQLGLLHKRLGDSQSAKRAFENAIRRFDALAPLDERPEFHSAYAQTIANLGLLNWTVGDVTEAALQFERALSVLGRAGAVRTENVELQGTWCKISGNHVALLCETDLDRAETELCRLIMELEQVIDQLQHRPANEILNAPTNGVTNRIATWSLLQENSAHLADLQNNLAIVLNRKNQPQSARRYALKAIDFWRNRFVQEGDSLETSERLATALNTLGEICWQSGTEGFGDDSFAEAEAILRRLMVSCPKRPEVLNRFAGVLHNRSMVARRNGDMDEARQLIQSAIQFQTEAVSRAPDNPQYRKFLQSHIRLRDVHLSDSIPGESE